MKNSSIGASDYSLLRLCDSIWKNSWITNKEAARYYCEPDVREISLPPRVDAHENAYFNAGQSLERQRVHHGAHFLCRELFFI